MASRTKPGSRPANKPPAASLAVADEWRRRIVAEYSSAAITQHLVLWLIQIGASPDLIRDGLRIVDDELTHAELSREVWAAAGATGAPVLDRESLRLTRRHASIELDVAAVVARVFCLGETVAVPLFQNLRRGATVPVTRRALDRIVRDEVRHRDFGWTALAWLLEQPCAADARALIESSLERWLAELERSYGEGRVAALTRAGGPATDVSADDRAWGLAPAAEYAAVLRRAIDRDFRPRFARLDIALPS